MQIAKRTCTSVRSPYKSTQVYPEEKFYILMDSQYGVIEIPVSYYNYLNSSNEQVHSYKIRALDVKRYLENTQDFYKAYPVLRYNKWRAITLAIGILSIVLSFAFSITCFIVDTSTNTRFWICGWFFLNVTAVVIAINLF